MIRWSRLQSTQNRIRRSVRMEAFAILAFCCIVAGCAPDKGPTDKPEPAPETVQGATYGTAASNPLPSPIPDRIVLTWKTDPSTSQAVTWRTDATVAEAYAEVVPTDGSPKFGLNARKVQAQTSPLQTESGLAHYHSVNLTGLTPGTPYAYRVGSGKVWSEWFHFRTASNKPAPFSFIYFGDAQNNILSLWSRTVRSAYSDAPKASFMVHAGDLINRANRDVEWGEWFKAGGWIHAMVPSVPTPGNHEYFKDEEGVRRVSKLWRPHFALPEHGVEGLEESVYYIDYQGARIISLNSNEKREEQAVWLEGVLKNNPNRWTFITFHHPIFSTAKGRDNKSLRELWKPLFDRYSVDLVLQGHDHTYGRGRNLPQGAGAHDGGTVYVVSVSGPKMYHLDPTPWWDRGAENTQLYQIISVTRDTVRYQAMTATGDLYDAFDLVKREGAPNQLIDRAPSAPERTHKTTIGGRTD